MTVYLVVEPGSYDESDLPKGVFSTLELAQSAAKPYGGEIYEVELDSISDPQWVRDSAKTTYWWDEQKPKS